MSGSEHVGEPVTVVVGRLGEPKRFERSQVHHIDRNGCPNHEADSQDLPFDVPEVPNQFAVDGFHGPDPYHSSSETLILRSFDRINVISPSDNEITRSAIAAIDAL